MENFVDSLLDLRLAQDGHAGHEGDAGLTSLLVPGVWYQT
jgi:hypothetical protein